MNTNERRTRIEKFDIYYENREVEEEKQDSASNKNSDTMKQGRNAWLGTDFTRKYKKNLRKRERERMSE